MTFLAPIALIGLLTLILPIVVHLFKPRKMRQTPFSSLRWLKATHQRLSRRIQWHQWLLFLMRAGCILLLVIAMAKPLLGLWTSEQPADRFLILDTSRSMAYLGADQSTPLERAQDLASRYVQSANVGDRTAVIVADASPRLIAPPSADASSSLAAIGALKPSLTDASLSGTLPLIRSLLPARAEREVELVFLTDNLAGRWQHKDVQASLDELPNQVRVKIVDTGSNAASNAWIAQARLLQFGADEDRWIRVELGCTKEPSIPRSVRLTGVAGHGDETQTIELKPGQISRVDFRIPASVKVQGQVAEIRLEPTDALASDDVYYINLNTSWATRVLLVEPETPGVDGRSVGLYLRVGMEVLAAAKNQALDVTLRTSAAVTASDFQKTDVVLLAGVPELSDAALEGLESRIRAGGGLAMFLGPQIKPAFYNEKLRRAHQADESLLPLALKTDGQALPVIGQQGRLTNVHWSHPLLAPLADPLLGDLGQIRFRRYAHLSGVLARKDTVLARIDDEMPAIVERTVGAGRVLFFNTSANGEWSDLPSEKRMFLPLLDRTLSYLASGTLKRDFTAGAAVTLPLPEGSASSDASVIAPSGAKLTPRWLMQRGQTLMRIDEIFEAGSYRVEKAGKDDLVFAVNASRTDSRLAPMDAKVLTEWFAPTAIEIVTTESAQQQLSQQSSHRPLWPALVLLAAFLLVVETIYVHRLCPRANPKSADAVVAERGVMKPLDTIG